MTNRIVLDTTPGREVETLWGDALALQRDTERSS